MLGIAPNGYHCFSKTMHKNHKSITKRDLLFIRYPHRNTTDKCTAATTVLSSSEYLEVILHSCHVQCEIKVTCLLSHYMMDF